MDRITEKHLQALCKQINKELNRPLEPWAKTEDGMIANIGNINLYSAYGHVGLEMMSGSGGATRLLIPLTTKRKLHERMQSMLLGIMLAK